MNDRSVSYDDSVYTAASSLLRFANVELLRPPPRKVPLDCRPRSGRCGARISRRST
jgi:hypothetical protein